MKPITFLILATFLLQSILKNISTSKSIISYISTFLKHNMQVAKTLEINYI
jgi:hypothetical protein